MTVFTTVESPLGPLHVAARDGALVALTLASPSSSWRRDDDEPALVEARAQLSQFFAGSRREFDLPLALDGTTWQRRVWDAVAAIPFGETRTYGSIAASLGAPGAARAVGHANGRNPACIVVPCHRVIGSDGSLTGYAYGIERKRTLLTLESAAVA